MAWFQPGGRFWLRRLASLGCRYIGEISAYRLRRLPDIYCIGAAHRYTTLVNSNLYTSILYNFINFHAKVLYKHTECTGSLGYNSVCYITSRIRWVFNVLGYGGKEKRKKKEKEKKRLGGIKGCKVFKEKSERYITSRNGWVSLKGIFRWYICSLLYYI